MRNALDRCSVCTALISDQRDRRGDGGRAHSARASREGGDEKRGDWRRSTLLRTFGTSALRQEIFE